MVRDDWSANWVRKFQPWNSAMTQRAGSEWKTHQWLTELLYPLSKHSAKAGQHEGVFVGWLNTFGPPFLSLLIAGWAAAIFPHPSLAFCSNP